MYVHFLYMQAYNTLTLVSRDSFVVVVAMMERIIMEYMFRMKESTRLQLLWLTREMVKTGISAVDRIVFALLKQIPGTYIWSHGSETTWMATHARILIHVYWAGLIASPWERRLK